MEHTGEEIALDLIVHTHFYIVQDGHVGEQTNILEGTGNAQLRHLMGGHPLGVDAVNQHRAAGGLIHAGKQVEDGGLACAVGANQAADFCGTQGDVEAVHSGQAAKVDAQVAHIQHQGLAGIGFPVGIKSRNLNGLFGIMVIHFTSASFVCFTNICFTLSTRTEFHSLTLGDQVNSITRISTTA